MAITTIAELHGARIRARARVHGQAAKAAAKAVVPFGLASAVWKDELVHLIDDVQHIFGLTPEQRAELEPLIVLNLTDLATAYAPAAIRAETVTALASRVTGNPIARIAGRSAGGRLARRIASGRGLLGALARRAWIVPLALGGATAATYELLGRRCTNQCYAYLHAQLTPPVMLTNR